MDYPRAYQNDYTQSFGQRRFDATETFGKREDSAEKVQRPKKEKAEQQKAWKMEFNFEDQGNKSKGREKAEQQQKAWKMEFNFEDQKDNGKRSRRYISLYFIEQEEHEQEVINEEQREPNLAELFKRNKKKMMEKYEHQRDQEPHKEAVKESKPTRTKEEILKLRKEMMSYKGPKNPKAATQEVEDKGKSQFNNPFATNKKSGKEPNPDLLDRLALGKKAKVVMIFYRLVNEWIG